MNKNLFLTAVTTFFLGMVGTANADTLVGKVTSIDQASNTITLVSETDNSSDRKEYNVVWDKELADSQQLESAQIGQMMTVDAEQNAILRHWKVKSIRGPLATAEETLLRTDDRSLNGEVLEIDTAGRSLVLRSKEMDDKGQPIQHRVVWDSSSENVQDKLSKLKVGDNITMTADQNMITKNWKARTITGTVQAMIQGEIRTVTGEVREVNSDKNFIVLSATDASGKAHDQKIVWDDDFKQQAKLEGAKVGDRLSVLADQNIITRNWRVTALS